MVGSGGVLGPADAQLSTADANALLTAGFGAVGAVERLSGERDQNFRVTDPDGRRWVLKISNSAERREVTNLQTCILLHLEQVDASLPVPRLARSSQGGPEYLWIGDDGVPRVVRLLTLLDGTPLRGQSLQPADLEVLGAAMARMDLALHDFRHPAERHVLLWDLQQSAGVSELVSEIQDAELGRLARAGLAPLPGVAERIGRLRSQMIHNDLNPDNLLTARRSPLHVSGIIDFGDAVRAPLIHELAVAASYHVRAEGDPFADVVSLARGYDRVLPLDDAEIEALPTLIVGRMAMTVAITSWRAARHQANGAYILRNRAAALAGLEALAGETGRRHADSLRAALVRARA